MFALLLLILFWYWGFAVKFFGRILYFVTIPGVHETQIEHDFSSKTTFGKFIYPGLQTFPVN
jgi:hypothetical protein